MIENRKQDILLESGTNELGVMEFTIANQHFGINVAKVSEILRYGMYDITPMPNANPFVEGIFKPREEVMTVINLAAYMGLPPSEDPERDILILTMFNRVKSAFHVHDVKEINRISWTAIEKPDKAIYGGEEGLATGIAHYDKRLITIVDFEKILADINPASGIQASELARFGDRPKSLKPVLVAEDSPLLERLIIESLEKAGYINVICCANGKEAWDKLIQFKATGLPIEDLCSMIITDIEMPQMDGHRLLKLIRNDEVLSHVPVIVFSSLITEEMAHKGRDLGATAQLSKPDIADLVAVIDKHIL
ncbi:MAG: chemotaxis protein [Clostridiales bacterium]|jgi:two-component system chemotaxis response regulator CheV|nr:chemotaxis protein [Clostridiales bacterium]